MSDRLLNCVREIDTVARLGGDEFAILRTAKETCLDAASAGFVRRTRDALKAPQECTALHSFTLHSQFPIARRWAIIAAYREESDAGTKQSS